MPRVDRHIVRPDRLDLDSPGRRDYWVALEHDSIWGDQLIPLTVMVGPEARDGRGLVAFGANHGNEYEGPMALKALIRELDPAGVTGVVVAQGFAARTPQGTHVLVVGNEAPWASG